MKILIQCDTNLDLHIGQVPIFCGTFILPYILNTV